MNEANVSLNISLVVSAPCSFYVGWIASCVKLTNCQISLKFANTCAQLLVMMSVTVECLLL